MILQITKSGLLSGFTIALVLSSFSFGQTLPSRPRPLFERSSKLWKWTSSKKHHQSVVKISVGDSLGTGVLIYVDRDAQEGDGYLGYCATAQHVIDQARSKDEIRVEYQNGMKATDCKVVVQNKDMDVALVWVWVPKDVHAAKLAPKKILRGEPVEFVGLGGRSDFEQGLRHFVGIAAAPTCNRKIYADETLLPGDSGGPIFNGKREVVGIISGGWFWWGDDAIKTDSGSQFRATWPARGSNIIPLAALIAELPPCDIGRSSVKGSGRMIAIRRPRQFIPSAMESDQPYVVYETIVPHPNEYEYWDNAIIDSVGEPEFIYVE